MRISLIKIASILCTICLMMACGAHYKQGESVHTVDELNAMAQLWRYRDLDSAAYYARRAYEMGGRYTHGRNMACNMLGFVAFERIEYDEALYWYEQVDRYSSCQLERLVADVGRMNVFQRTADNLAFYESKGKADQRLTHINEEVELFTPAELNRLQWATNDMHMVTALHHYSIGQRPEAHAEMSLVIEDEVLRTDTAQWLMYLYLKGIGLDVEGDTREQRMLRRYTYLNNCLRTSRTKGYGYFAGLASSGLAQLLADSVRMDYIAQYRPNSFAELTTIPIPAALKGNALIAPSFVLATEAMQMLEAYGDRYGAVNATIQIASLYNRIGEHDIALDTLQRVLGQIALLPIPDALCHLYEESSLAYAGLGDKASSDEHRNLYLDLLETTRQDKELESRYNSLRRQSHTMGILFVVMLVGIAAFVVMLILLSRRRRSQGNGYEQQLRNHLQEAEKRVYLHQMHIGRNKRDNVVRKASFSMVTGMMPYIDRIVHEVERLQLPEVWEDEPQRSRKLAYITELTQEINGLNEILTHWIKGKQGMVGLHVESFALSEVFDMLEGSATSFAMKELMFEVKPTDAVVKADKALTFFMLNTLADNARKFTPHGGKVSIDAQVSDDYVELSVSDTGPGMTSEEIARILSEKVYDAATIGQQLPSEQRKNKGSGFGLLNCKGIIEKYRKTDELFEVCRLGIESVSGEGSRFWFRLPKSTRRVLAMVLLTMVPWSMEAQTEVLTDTQAEVQADVQEEYSTLPYDSLLVKASAFADSVYYANVDGRYGEAIRYADSAIVYLNEHHCQYASTYIGVINAISGDTDTETRWWLSGYATDYHTILDIRNELAVANLALRRWNEYRYNNRIYNDLYKLVSEDRSLAAYCDDMQRYYNNTLVAVIVLVLLLVGYLVVILYAFMGRIENTYLNIESAEDDERRAQHEANRLHVQNMVIDNCLSTIKHETVYYPNRIKHLVERLPQHDERKQIQELIDYYKVVFTTLTNCASHQLDEITFRRSVVTVSELMAEVACYHAKACRKYLEAQKLQMTPCEAVVSCDPHLILFLMEQLIDASLATSPTDSLSLTAKSEGGFVRFSMENHSRELSREALHSLFSPSPERITCTPDGKLVGMEYIIAREIIREHDGYFGHIGCRINAEPTTNGYTIWFTIPEVK